MPDHSCTRPQRALRHAGCVQVQDQVVSASRRTRPRSFFPPHGLADQIDRRNAGHSPRCEARGSSGFTEMQASFALRRRLAVPRRGRSETPGTSRAVRRRVKARRRAGAIVDVAAQPPRKTRGWLRRRATRARRRGGTVRPYRLLTPLPDVAAHIQRADPRHTRRTAADRAVSLFKIAVEDQVIFDKAVAPGIVQAVRAGAAYSHSVSVGSPAPRARAEIARLEPGQVLARAIIPAKTPCEPNPGLLLRCGRSTQNARQSRLRAPAARRAGHDSCPSRSSPAAPAPSRRRQSPARSPPVLVGARHSRAGH